MWLFTKIGFFSATLAEETKDINPMLKVRARSREDLERLVAYMNGMVKDGKLFPPTRGEKSWRKIHEDRRADYYWRIFMVRSTWSKVVASLADAIDYGNFKAAVHGEPDRDSAYMAVWSAMNRLQEVRAHE
jgi:hypothetical protein